MAFRVGQKVVCVDASANEERLRNWLGHTLPVEGTIYTIRGWTDGPRQHSPGILLEEIRHELSIFGTEPNFRPWRFRPVQSTGTGMAILEQIRRDVSNKTALPIREDEQA
jgi:hypothetical protein